MTSSTKPPENVDETPDVARLDSSWVFIDRPATVDDVTALLRTLNVPYSAGRGPSEDGIRRGPDLPPLTMDRYLPYILPMSNNVKVKIPDPNNPQRTVDEYHMQTTLYTQVAGRLAILADVAERQHWRVDIYPEPVTPTGIPGYLRFDDRLVVRVYVEITDSMGQSLGKRFGTAWCKSEGGFNAEGSNPYETAETSALGRALAQWGFGILPGSGIASVEEMRLARQNLTGPTQGRRGGTQAPERVKEERGDLVASAIDFIEQRRKLSGLTQEAVDTGLTTWLKDKFGIEGFVTPTGGYEWPLLTDQQIALLRNTTRDAVVAATAAGEGSP